MASNKFGNRVNVPKRDLLAEKRREQASRTKSAKAIGRRMQTLIRTYGVHSMNDAGRQLVLGTLMLDVIKAAVLGAYPGSQRSKAAKFGLKADLVRARKQVNALLAARQKTA